MEKNQYYEKPDHLPITSEEKLIIYDIIGDFKMCIAEVMALAHTVCTAEEFDERIKKTKAEVELELKKLKSK